MTAKIKKLLTAAFCIVWSAILVVVPLAWFAGYWSSGSSSIDFVTSGNSALGDMWYWMYRSPFEVNSAENPCWIMYQADKTADNSGFTIEPYVENTGEGDQFVLSSLHFGKIDNLTSLNPDNRIYFCFKLNKDTHGSSKISFYFNYAEYSYTGTGNKPDAYPDSDPRYSVQIYDMDGDLIDHFGGYGLMYDASRPELMELLEFTYCLTKTAPPTAAQIEGNAPVSLNFSSPTAITHNLENQDTGLTFASGEGDYYLYVCISPKLENFGLHDHILEFFAQSYMLFDLSFSFEIHD